MSDSEVSKLPKLSVAGLSIVDRVSRLDAARKRVGASRLSVREMRLCLTEIGKPISLSAVSNVYNHFGWAHK